MGPGFEPFHRERGLGRQRSLPASSFSEQLIDEERTRLISQGTADGVRIGIVGQYEVSRRPLPRDLLKIRQQQEEVACRRAVVPRQPLDVDLGGIICDSPNVRPPNLALPVQVAVRLDAGVELGSDDLSSSFAHRRRARITELAPPNCTLRPGNGGMLGQRGGVSLRAPLHHQVQRLTCWIEFQARGQDLLQQVEEALQVRTQLGGGRDLAGVVLLGPGCTSLVASGTLVV
jgi:hypothetical protein